MSINSRRSVITAMYSAVICVGCFIAIPVGIVPIILQNMLAVMAGILFGLPQGAASVGLFLTAGVLGLPVFSGGRGGLAVLGGPTGGFLIGYFFASIITGIIAGKPSVTEKPFCIKNILRLVIAGAAGFIVVYIPGLFQFMRVTGSNLAAALSGCVIPFIPGDILKLIVMIPLCAKLRPVAARFLQDAEEQ